MFVERRTRERLEVRNGRMALLTAPWPASTVIGRIGDISMDGMAFQCPAEGSGGDAVCELGISCTDPYFYLGGLPCRIVAENIVADIPSSPAPQRRLSLKFGLITNNQASQLKSFIQYHSKRR
jgi:hypothetical protein